MPLQLKDAPQCDLFPREYPITFIQSPAGMVSLCVHCTLRIMNITIEEFEARHRPFKDWLSGRIKAALEKEHRAIP